jgi:anaphase-promoting complex subunit 8
LKPSNYLAYADLGELYSLEGSSRKSIKDFRISLRIDPFAFETDFFSHFHLANELTKIGSYNQAYFHYKKAIQLVPNDPNVWFNTGELLIKMHKLNKALLCFKKVLSINANDYAAKKRIKIIEDTKKTAVNN